MFCRIALIALLPGVFLAGAVLAAESDIDDLVATLRHPDDQVRVQAIDQLGRRGAEAAPAVPALEALLRDESAMVRAYAARSLGRIGAPALVAVPALMRSMADPELAVRRQAISALGRLRPDPEIAVGPFVRLMEDADPPVRLRALDALAEYGKAAVPALIELLEKDRAAYWVCLVLNQIGPEAEAAVPALADRVADPRPEVRREAILALAEIGAAADPAIDALTEALDDETIRLAATYAFGRIGSFPPVVGSRIRENTSSRDPLLRTISVWTLARSDPDSEVLQRAAVQRLAEALKSDDAQVRAMAARALASLEPEPELAAPILEEALRDADEQTIQYALDALAGLGAAMVPQLTHAMQFESLRPRIAFLLGEMGPQAEPAVDALLGLLDDPDPQTQLEALMALANIGPVAKSAVPALAGALKQQEGPRRYATVYALGRIGPEAAAAKPELLQATRSDDDTTALLSAWALAHIVPECTECAEMTVPLLIVGLKHPNAQHRREAAAALGAIGPLARPALPALEQAENDPDLGVRAAAAAALKNVRGI